MVVLCAKIKVKEEEEKVKQVEEKLLSLFPMVEKEEGTIKYIMHKDIEDPSTFFFYEKYKDKDAVDFHMNTAYIKDLISSFDDFLVTEPVFETYTEIKSI